VPDLHLILSTLISPFTPFKSTLDPNFLIGSFSSASRLPSHSCFRLTLLLLSFSSSGPLFYCSFLRPAVLFRCIASAGSREERPRFSISRTLSLSTPPPKPHPPPPPPPFLPFWTFLGGSELSVCCTPWMSLILLCFFLSKFPLLAFREVFCLPDGTTDFFFALFFLCRFSVNFRGRFLAEFVGSSTVHGG